MVYILLKGMCVVRSIPAVTVAVMFQLNVTAHWCRAIVGRASDTFGVRFVRGKRDAVCGFLVAGEKRRRIYLSFKPRGRCCESRGCYTRFHGAVLKNAPIVKSCKGAGLATRVGSNRASRLIDVAVIYRRRDSRCEKDLRPAAQKNHVLAE